MSYPSPRVTVLLGEKIFVPFFYIFLNAEQRTINDIVFKIFDCGTSWLWKIISLVQTPYKGKIQKCTLFIIFWKLANKMHQNVIAIKLSNPITYAHSRLMRGPKYPIQILRGEIKGKSDVGEANASYFPPRRGNKIDSSLSIFATKLKIYMNTRDAIEGEWRGSCVVFRLVIFENIWFLE